MERNRLDTIFETLQKEHGKKEDFFIHPTNIHMQLDGRLRFYQNEYSGLESQIFKLTDWSLGQLASKTGIPVRYLKNCPPELQAKNVNYWLKRFDTNIHNDWFIRTFNGQNRIVRGILSDKYTPFDDVDVFEILTKILGNSKADIDIQWWYRDMKGFYLRIIFKDLTTSVGLLEDGTPDIHQIGLHIENSEVGARALRITPFVLRLICTNGLMGWTTDNEFGIYEQRHIYLKHEEMYNRVAEAIGKALRMGDSMIEKIKQAKETPLKDDPLKVIEELAKSQKYSKEFTERLQGKFLQEEGNTVFHIIQSFTRASQELNADQRVEVEISAGRILDKLLKAS